VLTQIGPLLSLGDRRVKAVLRPAPLGGLAIPRARSFEIAVVDGAVLRTEPGRAPRTVATADESISILHVEHEQPPKRWRVPSESPYVQFVVGEQVRLAVPYLDVAPRFADSHREARDVSALTAVSRELGIPIEPMPSSRVEPLAAATPRSAIVRFDRQWSHPGTMALTVPVVTAFLAILFVLPQLELVAHIDVLTRAIGILVLPVAAWVLWLRLRSLWLVTRSPRPSDRTSWPPRSVRPLHWR
jgi:hypothetical protein